MSGNVALNRHRKAPPFRAETKHGSSLCWTPGPGHPVFLLSEAAELTVSPTPAYLLVSSGWEASIRLFTSLGPQVGRGLPPSPGPEWGPAHDHANVPVAHDPLSSPSQEHSGCGRQIPRNILGRSRKDTDQEVTWGHSHGKELAEDPSTGLLQ